MPIYEYECKQCGHNFEALVWSQRDEGSVCCPKCDGKELGRILSPFSMSSDSSGAGFGKSSCAPGSSKFS